MGLFRINHTPEMPKTPEGFRWMFGRRTLFYTLSLQEHRWGPFYKTVDSSPILDYHDKHPGGIWRTSWDPNADWTDDILIDVANYLLQKNIYKEKIEKGNR